MHAGIVPHVPFQRQVCVGGVGTTHCVHVDMLRGAVGPRCHGLVLARVWSHPAAGAEPAVGAVDEDGRRI
eukprot:171861-Chlamydomonas_euryale.AAC.1